MLCKTALTFTGVTDMSGERLENKGFHNEKFESESPSSTGFGERLKHLSVVLLLMAFANQTVVAASLCCGISSDRSSSHHSHSSDASKPAHHQTQMTHSAELHHGGHAMHHASSHHSSSESTASEPAAADPTLLGCHCSFGECTSTALIAGAFVLDFHPGHLALNPPVAKPVRSLTLNLRPPTAS